MCTGDQKRPSALQIWNGWLNERDRAPGDVLAEWLKEKTRVGLEAAGAALEAAWAHAESLRDGEGHGGILALEAMLAAPCGGQPSRAEAARDGFASEVEDGGGGAESVEAMHGAAEAPRGAAVPYVPDALEGQVAELFRLQDLNGDGLLQEDELVRLSEQVAALNGGGGPAVADKCREIFRTKLDPEGRPVQYQAFRQHMLRVLAELEPSLEGQLRMVQQFIAEAQAGRAALCYNSIAGGPDARSVRRPREAACPSAGCTLPAPPPAPAPRGISPSPGTAGQALSFADRVQSASAQAEVLARQGAEAAAPPPPPPAPRAPAPALGTFETLEDDGAARLRGAPAPRALAPGTLAPAREDEEACQGPPPEGHGRAESFDSVGSFVPAPAAAEAERGPPFAKGERVQVWSNSKRLWMDGFVEELFSEACEAEGYSIPAGTMKVRSPAGVKWVMADQVEGVLRKRRAG